MLYERYAVQSFLNTTGSGGGGREGIEELADTL